MADASITSSGPKDTEKHTGGELERRGSAPVIDINANLEAK